MADKYVAIVFPDRVHATAGLHALWHLDDTGDITVHGAVVVTHDDLGEIAIVPAETHAPWRTAAGLGLGALLGALGAPEYAVIGEIAEDWEPPLDDRMAELGGKISRRLKSDVRSDKWDGYNSVLYPYDYEPRIVNLA
jgi:hypothetical protein